TGEHVVDRRELPRDADRRANCVGFATEIEARNAHLASVMPEQCRQDLDRGRLAGTVRTEQGEDRPLGHIQVDAVEDSLAPERLAQPPGFDRQTGTSGGRTGRWFRNE